MENQVANKNKGQMQTKKLMPRIYWPTLSNKALSFRCTAPKKQKPFCLLRTSTKKQKHLFIPLSWLHLVLSTSCTKLKYGQQTYVHCVGDIYIYLHIQMINTNNTTNVTKLIRLGNYLELALRVQSFKASGGESCDLRRWDAEDCPEKNIGGKSE